MTDENVNYRAYAIFIVIEVILIVIPLIVLGAAIGWPGSLDEPASANLVAIHQNAGAVQFGYFVYLVYSILILPLSVVFYRLLIIDNDPFDPLLLTALGFGIASAISRTFGIIRWFTVMPYLFTELHHRPHSVSMVYESFNRYAGSVGEILGVQMFMVSFILLVSFTIMVRKTVFPKWVAYSGVIAAAFLAMGILELFGIEVSGMLLTLSGTILHLWLFAIAVFLFFRKSQSAK